MKRKPKIIKKQVRQKIIPTVKNGTVEEIEPKKGLTFRDKLKLKKNPETAFLITMRFSNGTRATWIIKTDDEVFEYKKRMYYLRYEDAFLDMSHDLYHIDYFDDHPTPISREVIKKIDNNAPKGKEQAYFTVTPSNLKPLIKMEYVKALAESHELTKFLKLALFFGIVNTVALMGILFKLFRG